MKYQVIYRTGGESAEIHSTKCKEFPWEDYAADIVVDADHLWGAAVEAWDHDSEPEFCALNFTKFAECLMPDHVPGPPRPRQKRPTKRNVPFDPETSTDAEVIEACLGKRLTWISALSGLEDTARLFPEGPHTKFLSKGISIDTYPHRHTTISRGNSGRRSLNFIEAGGYGFRSVGLETIVSVR